MTATGGHFVMNLVTGKKMHKPRVWEVPITESVIRSVESLAESQGYTSLKLTGKNKVRLLPSDWDEDEEYIYNNDYDDDDTTDDDDEEDNIDTFDEIENDEIDDLNNDTSNKETADEEADDAAEQPEEAIEQPQLEAIIEEPQNEQPIAEEAATDDDETITSSASNRPSRNRSRPEILTYDRMGETHHQK